MLLVDAIYIHESGGKVLLEYLIRTLNQKKVYFYLLLDKRVNLSLSEALPAENYIHLEATESARINFYKQLDKNIDTILCFANVPPHKIDKRVRVFIFFQNTLILSQLSERNEYAYRNKVSFLMRRIYIRYIKKERYRWIVQTKSMKRKLEKSMGVKSGSVLIIPFFQTTPVQQDYIREKKKNSFLYVADGVPQKNHIRLFKTWFKLSSEYDLHPELHVTLPERFTELLSEINALNEKGINIFNHGVVSKAYLQSLYQRSEFLIFPSVAESLGLPLLEAAAAGCKILASDLPYVYDIIEPTAVFDPYNIENISSVVANTIHNGTARNVEIKIEDQINELISLIT